MADTPPRSAARENGASEWLLTEPENNTPNVSARQGLATRTPETQSPVKQFLAVPEVALQLGVSNDYARDLIQFLLDKGYLIPKVDIIQIKPLFGQRRRVRLQYRQFRLHRVTGLQKLKAYLAPETVAS